MARGLRPDRPSGAKRREDAEDRAEKRQSCSHGTILSVDLPLDSPGPEEGLSIGQGGMLPRRKSTHVDDPREVGRRLKDARDRAGLSQRQLSFPGCSPAYISRIEAGDRIPSLQLLREMGRRLGVSEDYLATGTERGDDTAAVLEAELALRLDELELADNLFGQALERSETADDRARALIGLGQLAFRRGDVRQAIGGLEEARLLMAEKFLDSSGGVDTLGRAYAMIDDLDAAADLFRRALDAAEARKDPVEAVRFAVLLANAHVDKGDFAAAEALLERTMTLAPDANDPILRARLYWSQSRLHSMQNDSRAAARYARKALELLELTENTYYTARAHQLLAHIELDRKKPEHALELVRKGLVLLEKGGNDVERALFRLEEARALVQLGEREEAASIAMECAGQLSDASPFEAGRGYALVAEVFEGLGDRAKARELYELAAEMHGAFPSRYLLDVYSRLAQLLEADGEKDEALEVLKKAVAVRAATGSQ
jgi:tetratricopeptide (TPR) repeat protein